MSRTSTRDRVMAVALRLFADHGYDATTVGGIEEAAGLAPRAGGFYRHFQSKEAVLEAVLEREVESLDAGEALGTLLPLGDPRAELALLCRWSLAEMDRKRLLIRVLMRDGDRLPALVARAKNEWIERSYERATAVIAHLAAARGRTIDTEAIAVVALGAIANVRLSATLFHGPPLAMPDDRFVAAWVEMVTAVVDAAG